MELRRLFTLLSVTALAALAAPGTAAAAPAPTLAWQSCGDDGTVQ